MAFQDPLLLPQQSLPKSVPGAQPFSSSGFSTSSLPDPWNLPQSPATVQPGVLGSSVALNTGKKIDTGLSSMQKSINDQNMQMYGTTDPNIIATKKAMVAGATPTTPAAPTVVPPTQTGSTLPTPTPTPTPTPPKLGASDVGVDFLKTTLSPDQQATITTLEGQLGRPLTSAELNSWIQTQGAQKTQTDITSEKAAEAAQLQASQQNLETAIQKSYGARQATEMQRQSEETSQQRGYLANLGALGTTSEAGDITQNITNYHQQIIGSIEGERDMLIAQARSALDQKQVDLAQKYFGMAQDKQKEAFDQRMQMQSSIQTAAKAQLEQAQAERTSKYQTVSAGGSIFDYSTGKFVTAPGKDSSSSLMTKYPDAGIVPGDDPATVTQKLQNSPLYQKAIGSGGAIPQDAIEFMAGQYLVDGKMPSLGLGSTGAGAINRAAFFESVASQARAQGLTPAAAAAQKSATKAYQQALDKTETNGALVTVASEKAKQQIQVLQPLIDKVDNTGVPALNRWINAGKTNIAGDVDVAKLNQAMQTLQFEYGKVASGAVGIGGVAISSQEDVNKAINAAMSPDQLKGLLEQMSNEIDRATSAYQTETQNLKDKISSTGQADVGGGSTSGGTSGAGGPDSW